jgi:hypothetical protein
VPLLAKIRNCCSVEVGVALSGHSDTSRNTRGVVSTYDVKSQAGRLKRYAIWGAHSGVAEDQVFWDVTLCLCLVPPSSG